MAYPRMGVRSALLAIQPSLRQALSLARSNSAGTNTQFEEDSLLLENKLSILHHDACRQVDLGLHAAAIGVKLAFEHQTRLPMFQREVTASALETRPT